MLRISSYFITSLLFLSSADSFAEDEVEESNAQKALKAVTEAKNAANKAKNAANESSGELSNLDTVINNMTNAEDNLKALIGKENQSLEGFNFSVGIGYEMFRTPYIKEAKLRGSSGNQVVVITDKYKGSTSLWLTTNYIWDGKGALWEKYSTINPGVYIGTRVVGDNVQAFDALSIGVMLAFKRKGSLQNYTFNSLNIGLGAVWHRTQELAYGIQQGSALPSYYSDIEYQKKDEWSPMLMLSVGFN